MSEHQTPSEPRKYHHGDLGRALIDAARVILEQECPAALSLRAVARQAGVSPAAPYHHFKDKDELLEAVALEGWSMLDVAVAEVKSEAPSIFEALPELLVAYVTFARENPAIYRVMFDVARHRAALPRPPRYDEESAFQRVRANLIAAGVDPNSSLDLELSTTAVLCAAHGLAELTGFKQFDPLKEACGGEAPFLRAVLDHMGLFPKPR